RPSQSEPDCYALLQLVTGCYFIFLISLMFSFDQSQKPNEKVFYASVWKSSFRKEKCESHLKHK
ncbi:hypothetical protein, partial [Carboxylicivirga taeanensis]|uniref:hypothetical protein n=1 Tax=Carboxylicivirga taeanensis TaxID=1416875 RepID=UPI003F6E06E2